MNQKLFLVHLLSEARVRLFLFDSLPRCSGRVVSIVEVMETLHVDGQSIKFVDRKLWKRDSFDGKLNFDGKLFKPSSSKCSKRDDDEKDCTIRRKCPIEVDYPRKRRILKRPKRFKTYYSDRKPLSIPRFSFPRWLMGN